MPSGALMIRRDSSTRIENTAFLGRLIDAKTGLPVEHRASIIVTPWERSINSKCIAGDEGQFMCTLSKKVEVDLVSLGEEQYSRVSEWYGPSSEVSIRVSGYRPASVHVGCVLGSTNVVEVVLESE